MTVIGYLACGEKERERERVDPCTPHSVNLASLFSIQDPLSNGPFTLINQSKSIMQRPPNGNQCQMDFLIGHTIGMGNSPFELAKSNAVPNQGGSELVIDGPQFAAGAIHTQKGAFKINSQ